MKAKNSVSISNVQNNFRQKTCIFNISAHINMYQVQVEIPDCQQYGFTVEFEKNVLTLFQTIMNCLRS